ncbi:MAG: prepilin-type N-terminal cleavage/methylation domain-containing protein [Deltaproteobacteria bacterium]|nr:prepilin-type N-terminal cleavage/methylation domain-containing protein [Deltaproteobacteria bacterium]
MRPSHARGFTLIEVMAAAIILLLVVAALSEMLASQARREGDARGEALAALFADRAIAEIEESIARGAAPQLGRTERSEDDLRATIEVRAFDSAAAASALLGAARDAGPEAAAAAGAQPSGGWLASPAAQNTPPVLEISVRVSRSDAAPDAEAPPLAERTTFALNPAALATLEGKGDENEDDGEGDG